ncbi:MAG TPA: signal peptidase II [Thermoanaerobaculia bacterium]|nr:signal peptidase II [Thermoanaerobaculia bacterium]
MSDRGPSPSGRVPARFPAKPVYLLISLAVLALDQWSKWLVERHLPLHAAEPVIPGVFYLTHVRNTGVAFGLFAERGAGGGMLALVLLGFAALTVVGIYFWKTPRESRLLLTSLALVLGGAVGNLLDRIAAGAVTDFLGVFLGSYRWPDFNVADSAISVGLTLLLLESLLPRPAARSAVAPADPAS